MCANCVSKADVIVGTLGFGAYVFKGPAEDALIALGLLPEKHPLAVEMRTLSFLRDLELDPRPILGDDVVDAADRALAFPRQRVYRRSFREALALFTGGRIGSMRSQTVPATQ
jgi:hypothetical protein